MRACAECGVHINDPLREHFTHDHPRLQMVCDCDRVVCAGCCPDCNEEDE